MAKDTRLDEIVAGDNFRRSLLERADSFNGEAPLWHGWALMDAFLAGRDYANNLSSPEETERLRKHIKKLRAVVDNDRFSSAAR